MQKESPLKHLSIIMDGNGRWAEDRGLPRCAGHKAGVDAVDRCVELCIKAGIPVLSLFAFSHDNWQRSPDEVDHLFELFNIYFDTKCQRLVENGVRLKVIGERSRIPEKTQRKIKQAQQQTGSGTKLELILALNYSGRWDIAQGINRLLADYEHQNLPNIDAAMLTPYLEISDVPEPDIVVRTAGEQRISNFFLWQIAYSELMFIDTCWPDFSVKEFEKILASYGRRNRTYGAVPSIDRNKNIEDACPLNIAAV